MIMTSIYSRELSRDELPQWDDLVDHSSHGTIFHKSGWLDACARSLGIRLKIFGCFQNNQLIGGCSLFIEQKWGWVSLADSTCPMTPYGGFILSFPPSPGVHKQESFHRQIIGSLIKEIEKEHFFSINIINSPDFLDIRPFTSIGWESGVLYTYYSYLDNKFESHIDPVMKKNIRKAERNHIIIEPFSDISRYYSLLCETYTRKDLDPPCSENLIKELYSFMLNHNCGEMVAAKTPDNEIACADIIVWDTRQAYGFSAASDARFNNSGSPSLIRFEHLKRMQAKGILKMNLMMGNVLELSQFTTQLNPTLVPYYQIRNRRIHRIIS